MPQPTVELPKDVVTSTFRHRVPFFDTDAMGIVHHANYVRYLELARVHLLEEHDQPYEAYIAQDRHFAVTRCEVSYAGPARFGDELDIVVWVKRVAGASVEIAYRIECRGTLVVTAETAHAMVDSEGRPRRIPRERRQNLARLAGGATSRIQPGAEPKGENT